MLQSDVTTDRSQNARTHGLTAEPRACEVRNWYYLIMDGDMTAWGDPDPSPLIFAAHRLATAEARVQAALRHMQDLETDPNAPQQVLNRLGADMSALSQKMGRPSLYNPHDPYDLAQLNFGVAQMELLLDQADRRRRLAKRYLGEARAERSRAFRDWCALGHLRNVNSRNETKYN